jgi:hypothetical protein
MSLNPPVEPESWPSMLEFIRISSVFHPWLNTYLRLERWRAAGGPRHVQLELTATERTFEPRIEHGLNTD